MAKELSVIVTCAVLSVRSSELAGTMYGSRYQSSWIAFGVLSH